MKEGSNLVIQQTKYWIKNTVIGLNFCPFASQSFIENKISYKVEFNANLSSALEGLMTLCNDMIEDSDIETALLILPDMFSDFFEYLDLVEYAEKLLQKEKLEGVFQIASFHPLYQFAGTIENDPSNYTNRSPYPMLHILREESVEKALDKLPHPEQIPERNIAHANQLGLDYMKQLLNACFGDV